MALAGLWVQLFLALGWTVYVIFLPQLAAQAGIAKELVPWLLLADQAIFAAMDWTLGTMADRVAGAMRRLANAIALVTLVSCGSFLVLPLVAPAGSPALFVAVTVLWSATSSALRAPPLVLIGRHVPGPSQPWAAALFMLGMGIAGAIAPYLTVALRGADPRLPFALSAVALAVAAIAMTRAIGANPQPAVAAPAAASPLHGRPVAMFLFAVALLGLGFQVHFALNSAPGYLRFAKPGDLQYLMPVFWVGFNLLILPAALLTKRYGGLAMMAVGAAAGGLAAAVVANAGSLPALVAAQFLAGGAWGCVMMSALSAALAMGRTGREGFVSGALWSLLALATFTRIALVIGQVPQQAAWKPLLAWAPGAMWLTAGLLLVAAATASRKAGKDPRTP
ncbi:MAG: MFS transporter [Lysobacter sp.]|nr:MFS transporter [Lysobacter sp.]